MGLFPPGLEPAKDLSSSVWVQEALKDRPEGPFRVHDLVPSRFEAYARILHAPRRPTDLQLPTGTWNARAAEVGVPLGPGTRWEDLEGPGSDTWALWPGEMMGPEVGTLARILAEYTSSANACSFGFWSGWGHLDASGALYMAGDSLTQRLATWRARADERRRNRRNRMELRRLPTFPSHGGSRSYLLFHGPIAKAESFWSAIGQCPTMWWPEDRAWFVHTSIEATSTYLGGSQAVVDQLVGEQVLESFEVQPHTPVVW
jgi:hypothetical protein